MNGAAKDASGIYRWTTNGAVPFEDKLRAAGVSEAEIARHNEVREAESRAIVAAYRARLRNLTPEQQAERAYERRAAFGPGQVVVNVITGQRFRT